MKALILSVLLPLLPSHTIKNFDQQVSERSPFIMIAPPYGKVWKIQRASFALAEPVSGVKITVFEETAPYGPSLRTSLIQADLGKYGWIPIVGGYYQVDNLPVLKGQDSEIELHFPTRLVIAVTGIPDGNTLDTWTRASIQETDEPSENDMAHRADRH